MRAYGGTAAECLRLAPKLEVRPRVTLRVSAPFALTGAVWPVVTACGAQRLKEEFSGDGLVLEISLEEGALPAFETALGDATRGKARIERL